MAQAFPPLPPPVPVDPEVIVLIGATGAVLGALAAVGGYLATEWASARGREQRVLPEAAPFLVQE